MDYHQQQYSSAGYRGGNNGYGIPAGQPAPQLFEDTSGSGGSSFPPVGTAQQLLSNPMVTEAAIQYGQGLVSMGQSYLDSTVNKYAPGLKVYFAVDTSYVLNKIRIILFPYTHREWSPQYISGNPVEPRKDLNVPDLYIPVMGLITYVLLTGFIMGTQMRFTPEDLGINASSLLAWLAFEIILIWLGLFLARVTAQLSLLDIISYCSYKYISMIVSVGASLLGGPMAYYATLAWTTTAIAYFEVGKL
jgi:hypothetical protein